MSEDVIRLQNAQKTIRDAYFENDSGLFTLDCVPGAGKSEVSHHIPAETIIRRFVNGDPTPEQHVAVVSFTKTEAATIVPAICERIREIVENDLVPAATDVSPAELEYVIQRVRTAPYVGTIDSILRDIFQELVDDVGFEEMPVVGNTARLQQLHTTCYEDLQDDTEIAAAIHRLEAAYPDEQYKDGLHEMIQSAVDHCRTRQLSTEDLRSDLERTLESVYKTGAPESFDDVVAAIRRYVGVEVSEDRFESLSEDDQSRVVNADQDLHNSWESRIDDFCTVVRAYRHSYCQRIRDQGIVSHTDVAYLVASYFGDRFDNIDTEHRHRVKKRYQTRIQSLIIDEAQDVSTIQHAALSHLVTADTRVFAAGDLRQSIYRWRDADPALFEAAIKKAEYLGIDWQTGEHQTATTTYRSRPEVAAAINRIAEPVLTDAGRGNIGEIDVPYPDLEANRERTDGANVHVAAFDPVSHNPGSYRWVNPFEGGGEAPTVARLISKGLADGTFTNEDGDPLEVTVLFRASSKMDTYAEAFEDEGLQVRTTSKNLFESPVVTAVFDVCEWLVNPGSTDRTTNLVSNADLGLQSLDAAIQSNDGRLDTIIEECDLNTAQADILDGLMVLRDRRDQFLARPAATYVEDIIEHLKLRADPHSLFDDTDPAQRVANLDALETTLNDWETDDFLSPKDLIELVEPFRANIKSGPDQPSTAGTDFDVEFRTVHNAKGDESDVIVIANPGFDLWRNGVHTKRLATASSLTALAPPTDVTIPTDVPLPPYLNNLYNPSDTRDPDVGLRWATAHWRDDKAEDADPTTMVGPDSLQRIAANERAEEWRILYVALTRTREHLVVPLPRSLPNESRPRDRWLDTLRDALRFTGEQNTTYTIDDSTEPETKPFDIAVNDVEFDATWTTSTTDQSEAITNSSPRRDDLNPWVPRFVNPSTMHPLTEDPDTYVLNHLLENALHTQANEVPDNLPLVFDDLGPDDVGTCLHEVLTTLVEREVSSEALQTIDEEVRHVFDTVVNESAPWIADAEREGLFVFFTTYVLPDFRSSDLWQRIQNAERVTVEQPIDGLFTFDDAEIELHGTADFVVETPSGELHVTDAKIALTELTTETQQRYELQAAAYSYLFRQKNHSPDAVHRAVETFGVDHTTTTSSLPPETVETRLTTLIQSSQN